MASDADLLAAAEALINKVNRACATWRFADDLYVPMAAAGLCRTAGILEQAIVLAKQPPSIGANILVRAAFETWLVGVWALFGGNDAVLGIEKERIRNETALVEKNSLPAEVLKHVTDQRAVVTEAQDRLLGGAAPSSVKYEQMATDLAPLIKAQTREHEDADVLAIYSIMYRAHSTNDAHPWKPLGQYLQDDGRTLRVVPFGPWNNPVEAIASMSMYAGILGRWIDESQRGSDPEWDELVVGIHRMLET